ncbi:MULTISPECIES: glycoside hydrolase family 3 C-terminal domain-containing protein [Streptomyces]|uniref:Glycoside hydrolase family 3 C-terminal domain-containing protein n=2 Tax=Streptomyces TaxID=1883 RepID=A0ABV9J7C8_9ACTN
MTSDELGHLAERIEKAIDVLDLEHKVRLLTGAAMFALHAEPAIDLGEVRLSDGPTGVRGPEFTGGRRSCLLPNATVLAQHWDAGVAEQVGELLAEEAAAHDTHVVLGPTINLHRTPLGGRLFETFSEDPLLTGALAGGVVRGLQRHGVAATPKHFLANEAETDRTTVDSVIDERTLREVYLLPFEMVVTDARAWSVMAAYNRVNGTASTEHAELIKGVLKGEWGFDGVVMSDWYATRSTTASANGGLDLVMPGPGGPWDHRLVAAVRAGEVEESAVDEHLRRLLRLAARVGRFPAPSAGPSRVLPAPDSPVRREQLRRLAAGGMTVLANRDAALPLAADVASVVVIGRHAVETIAQGGGSAKLRPPHVVSVAEGLTAALGPDKVSVVDGVEVRHRPVPVPDLLRDPETGRPGMRVTARDAYGEVVDSRHVEVTELVTGRGSWLDSADTIELTARIGMDAPTRMQVGVTGLGEWTVRAGAERYTVARDGAAAFSAGVLNPPSWTTNLDLEPGAVLTACRPRLTEHSRCGLIARPASPPPAAAIGAAARAAARADLAVVVVGLTDEQETEGLDKTTLALPGEQDALVVAVAAAAKRTVVVVNAATPVLMPWLDRVDAVLWAGLPGQEAGAAVAAALLGEIEPAGRLVTTFPARDGDGPVWGTTPTDGALAYTEGSAFGYRGWAADQGPRPRFWFGHGLGYGAWRYDHADLAVQDGAVRSVRAQVTNIGAHASREVVQAYLRPADPAEPVRLIGWAGAEVLPGRTATIEVPCDARTQRRWDPGARAWRSLEGGEVVLARGLGDIRITLAVYGPR